MAVRLKSLIGSTVVCLICGLFANAQSEKLTWQSITVGASLSCEIFTSKTAAVEKNPIIVLIRNLPGQKVEDAKQTDELTSAGYLVMSVDYARNPKATGPNLNADLLKLRKEVPDLLEKYKVDQDRMFLLPEGYRIVENVEYYRQDGRSYRFDVRYPISRKVPVVVQTSHDNVDRRRNHGYVRYNDTLLEGLMLRGYAVVMIEHLGVGTPGGKTPVMPDYIYKLKSAVRTVRANAEKFNIDGNKMAAIGFSKGGTASAMLATMNEKDLEGDGLHREFSSKVTAALCLAGGYDLRDFDEI